MSILDDAERDQMQDAVISDPEPFQDDYAADSCEDQQIHFDFSFLRTPTGPGSIDDYIDHPLNGTGSRGMAQIIRGCTGLAGSLDLAIIDITIGALQLVKEKKADPIPEKSAGVNYEPIINSR